MCRDVDSCADVQQTSADSENNDAQRWRVRRGGCVEKILDGLENGGETPNLTSLGKENSFVACLRYLPVDHVPLQRRRLRGGVVPNIVYVVPGIYFQRLFSYVMHPLQTLSRALWLVF